MAEHSHSHVPSGPGNVTRLKLALGVTAVYLICEIVGGILTGSLALLSDAAHMFTDTAALAIALAAIRLGQRPADKLRTYGYQRFEILAATFNALLLLIVALYIVYEAYQRWRHPTEVQSTGMLVLAAIGLVVNLISMNILSGGKTESVNMKGAYLEVWSDMLGSIGVIISALIIRYTGWVWVDSLTAVGIGLWVLPRTWTLLKETTNVLLEGAPAGTQFETIHAMLTTEPGVAGVHDLHIWAITSGVPALTAHVVYSPGIDPQPLLVSLTEKLEHEFDIHHLTLQLEDVDCGQRHTASPSRELHVH